jgi:colanic acid biosynthesis glycosyl transferase WcaI
MTRILFVNRYFFPDHSATSQILSDLAFGLAAAGRSVAVITSQQRYHDPHADLPRRATERGVDIHRMSTTRFGRTGLAGRSLDYLSFYCQAFAAVRRLAQPGDIVVAKTDPPLLSIVAALAARQRRAHLVNWLQDLYPEVAAALGVPLLKGPLGSGLAQLRDWSLRAATTNVVLERRMAERLRARGLTAERIEIIPNWSDDDAIIPIPAQDNPLRRAWGLEEKFVVGYSGNLGRAHDYMTLLNASEQLRDHPNIVFLMVGGGHQFDALIRDVKARGLDPLYRFQPYQNRVTLNHSLAVPDLHWISLKPDLEGLIVPSKFYGIAAAGRPIITIADADGDLARLVREHHCGLVVAPGDATALADGLRRLAADPNELRAMGIRARAMLEARFTRRQAFERWRALLARIEATTTSAPLGPRRAGMNAPI